jgi:hypothetical protein
MTNAIAGGMVLPWFGDRAAGAGSIGSGGLNLFIGRHMTSGRRLTRRSGDRVEVFIATCWGVSWFRSGLSTFWSRGVRKTHRIPKAVPSVSARS